MPICPGSKKTEYVNRLHYLYWDLYDTERCPKYIKNDKEKQSLQTR